MKKIAIGELMTLEEAAERLGGTPDIVENMVFMGLIAGAYGADPSNPVLTADSPVMVFRKDIDDLDAETVAATGLTMKQLVARTCAAASLAKDSTRSVQ